MAQSITKMLLFSGRTMSTATPRREAFLRRPKGLLGRK
jgi:hypothetical protein